MAAAVEVYQDKAGEWRWRLVEANGRVIADSAEGYTRQGDAWRAWKGVHDALMEGVSET